MSKPLWITAGTFLSGLLLLSGVYLFVMNASMEKFEQSQELASINTISENPEKIEQLIQNEAHQRTAYAWLFYMTKTSEQTDNAEAVRLYLKAITMTEGQDLYIMVKGLEGAAKAIPEPRRQELQEIGVTVPEPLELPSDLLVEVSQCRATLDDRYFDDGIIGLWGSFLMHYDYAYNTNPGRCLELKQMAQDQLSQQS
jgi:hypothetical protein